MGAWDFVRKMLSNDMRIIHIARPESGSPATGSSKFHIIQQKKIVEKTFHECDCPYINYECEMACIGNRWQSFEKEIEDLQIETIDAGLHNGLKPLK